MNWFRLENSEGLAEEGGFVYSTMEGCFGGILKA